MKKPYVWYIKYKLNHLQLKTINKAARSKTNNPSYFKYYIYGKSELVCKK